MENYCYCLIILLCNITTPICSSSTTHEQVALLAFKNDITSDPRALLANWSTDASICNWIGVTCDLNLQTVTALNISRFALAGTIAPHIANLTSLRSLDLSFNYFTGFIPPSIGNLHSLMSLRLHENSLKGSIPLSIFNISNLRFLQLSFNQLNGTLSPNMGISLLSLEKFYINGNRLTGLIPTSITNASKLTHLGMNHNSFTGSLPSFGDLELLQVLRIRGNNLVARDIEFLSSLSKCRYLEVLEVSDNPLNGILDAASVGNLSNSLVQFGAGGCNLSGVIPPEIGKLNRLMGLYLYENRLQGYIPHQLCEMNNLAELDLSGNILSGPILGCFGENGSLRKIHLGSNKLNSTIPSTFWNLSKLLILNLSSNSLSGNLSMQIGDLKAIYIMDLSLNQFSGDIPSSLDSCQSLETLSLSNNMLTGSIPQSLGNIRGLHALDLSNNSLTGSIPKSLEQINFLGRFNASYNSLAGEIPKEGPFVNFTEQSYVHNLALCGFQASPCTSTNNHGRPRLKGVGLLILYIVASSISVMIWVIILLVITRMPLYRQIRDRAPAELGVNWRTISHRELANATNGFSEINLLGKGSSGSVFKGTLQDGTAVAIKVFDMGFEGAAESFNTECQILSSIRHRNLIRIIGCCSNTEFKALVLEYMENMSLDKLLDTLTVPFLQRLDIAIDVASALEYLHHNSAFPVVHCDIKPSNILVDEDMTAHLADFGIAKLPDGIGATVLTQTLGTIGYIAPEYGAEGIVSTKGDVYSYGIMLLEMFTKKTPTDEMFYGDMGLKEWVMQAVARNAITEVLDPALNSDKDRILRVFDVAMLCLAVSPAQRINMIQVNTALQSIKDNAMLYPTANSSPYFIIT